MNPAPPRWDLCNGEGLCGLLGTMDDREASSSLQLSLESWFNGNTDTKSNHTNIILAKCSDVINLRLDKRILLRHESCSHIQVSNTKHKTDHFILTFLGGSYYFSFVLTVIFYDNHTTCFSWIQVLTIGLHEIHAWKNWERFFFKTIGYLSVT